jgi:hypothetical protein
MKWINSARRVSAPWELSNRMSPAMSKFCNFNFAVSAAAGAQARPTTRRQDKVDICMKAMISILVLLAADSG